MTYCKDICPLANLDQIPVTKDVYYGTRSNMVTLKLPEEVTVTSVQEPMYRRIEGLIVPEESRPTCGLGEIVDTVTTWARGGYSGGNSIKCPFVPNQQICLVVYKPTIQA